jgi:uncharacterized protein DUF3106
MPLFAAAVLALALQGPSLPAEHPRPASDLIKQVAGWDDLNSGQRDRALRNYKNYMALPQEKRRDIDQRYEKWKRLPPSDQDRFRRKHDEYHGRGLVDD